MAITLIKVQPPIILSVENQDMVRKDLVVEYFELTGDGSATTIEIPTLTRDIRNISICGKNAVATVWSDMLINGTTSYNGATVQSVGITTNAIGNGDKAIVKIEGTK